MAAGQMEMPDEIFIKIFSYLQIHDLFRIGGTWNSGDDSALTA